MKHLRVLRAIAHVAQTGSIRKAANALHITSSALNRQIQDFEEELGTPVFERVAKGVRLNTAGELVIQHIRHQISDFERLQSQIADLSGLRRGHVTIAASQVIAHRYLAGQIHAYRKSFPYVSFTVKVLDYAAALGALQRHEVDLAVILQPHATPDFLPLFSGSRWLMAVMAGTHPLAKKRGAVRLRDCLQYPLALPDSSLAGRLLFDEALARTNLSARIEIESSSLELLAHYLVLEPMVSFQIADEHTQRAAARQSEGEKAVPDPHAPQLVMRCVDPRDSRPAHLELGQLRGRVLPVAAAKFGEQLALDLDRTPST